MTPMLDMAFQLLAFFILTFKVPVGRDPRRPRPARDAGRPARRRPKAEPSPGRLGPSTPTWRTTCWSAPRPTTWAT